MSTLGCFWHWMTEHATVISTVVSAIAAVFIACFSVTLARVSKRQAEISNRAAGAAEVGAEAARRAADVANTTLIASQRAWLTVEVSIAKGQGLTFDRNGAVLQIRIDMKNIGNAPALKVSWRAWPIFHKPFQTHNPGIEQSRRCRAIRQQEFGIGPTIFPQDRYPVPGTDWGFGAGLSWAEIDEMLGPKEEGKPRITGGVTLVGCIDYTFPSDNKVHHQTGFMLFGETLPFPIPEITEQSGNITVPILGLIKQGADFDPPD
ncbi:MAG TPA: hypothetical protein VJ487_15690 [Alphaproteobacteria bacterium]|nr:hypothetical protein [Alphaproteobacteria bacterium]